jgi:hypothetical protein
VLALLAGCASDYVGTVERLKVPTDEMERQAFCENLRQNRARLALQSYGNYSDPTAAALDQIGTDAGNRQVRQDVAAIDQKMADAACNLPHMPAQSCRTDREARCVCVYRNFPWPCGFGNSLPITSSAVIIFFSFHPRNSVSEAVV